MKYYPVTTWGLFHASPYKDPYELTRIQWNVTRVLITAQTGNVGTMFTFQMLKRFTNLDLKI